MNKQNLKDTLNYINRARLVWMASTPEGENAEWVVKLTNALIDAENAGLNLWDSLRIQAPDGMICETLDDKEESIYLNLQSILRFDDEMFSILTEAQKFSAARVINRQGINIQRTVSCGRSVDMLGIAFPHIFIGIEPDGYAHS